MRPSSSRDRRSAVKYPCAVCLQAEEEPCEVEAVVSEKHFPNRALLMTQPSRVVRERESRCPAISRKAPKPVDSRTKTGSRRLPLISIMAKTNSPPTPPAKGRGAAAYRPASLSVENGRGRDDTAKEALMKSTIRAMGGIEVAAGVEVGVRALRARQRTEIDLSVASGREAIVRGGTRRGGGRVEKEGSVVSGARITTIGKASGSGKKGGMSLVSTARRRKSGRGEFGWAVSGRACR